MIHQNYLFFIIILIIIISQSNEVTQYQTANFKECRLFQQVTQKCTFTSKTGNSTFFKLYPIVTHSRLTKLYKFIHKSTYFDYYQLPISVNFTDNNYLSKCFSKNCQFYHILAFKYHWAYPHLPTNSTSRIKIYPDWITNINQHNEDGVLHSILYFYSNEKLALDTFAKKLSSEDNPLTTLLKVVFKVVGQTNTYSSDVINTIATKPFVKKRWFNANNIDDLTDSNNVLEESSTKIITKQQQFASTTVTLATAATSSTTASKIPEMTTEFKNEFAFFKNSGTGVSGIIQQYKIRQPGCYIIKGTGAKGGSHKEYTPGALKQGGYGATKNGMFYFNSAPHVLLIVVGQRGGDAPSGFNWNSAGGGGGTFVYSKKDGNVILYLAAGGGGGASYYTGGINGSITENGTAGIGSTEYASGSGGTEGNGGKLGVDHAKSYDGGCGGGWKSSGENARDSKSGQPGKGYVEEDAKNDSAFRGGSAGRGSTSYGGYGSGGGAGAGAFSAAGAGGGYSGGGTGGVPEMSGGAGGSYLNTTYLYHRQPTQRQVDSILNQSVLNNVDTNGHGSVVMVIVKCP